MLRSSRYLPLAVIFGLLVMVAVVSLLWNEPLLPVDEQGRMPVTENPFPVFPLNETLHVVSVGENVSYSTRLTLLSIQGIVNRDLVQLYLDTENETSNDTSMLNFISSRYGIAYDVVDIDWTLERYLREARGLYVFDPGRPESVNIGTMYAALQGLVIAGPKDVEDLSQRGQLPILLDYAASEWALLNAAEAYDKALDELYPQANRYVISILPPEEVAIRDYLIAAKIFVFYRTQGALASPQDLSVTWRVLRNTPRGIPIIGWFDSLTETEENLFVQMASSEGKHLTGFQEVPNLTVLSAIGRDQAFKQTRPPAPAVNLEDRTYAVVAVADGDNLDFVAHRMRKLWESPVRGTIPIAWSLNPLFVELAPPYLDYFYGTATSQDSFIASPSGAGYLYPDYLEEADLQPYLEWTAGYLESVDMDVIWLLNAFPAGEIQYSPARLSAYVEGLDPRGLVLDYADEPTTRSVWMQEGGGGATPVVRSTHLWTTKENFLGKARAAMNSWGSGPHFIWITVYPWRFDLEDAMDVIHELEERTSGGLEVVSPEAFFALLLKDFQAGAREGLEERSGNPLTSAFLTDLLRSADGHIAASEALSGSGDRSRAAYEAFLAQEDLRLVAMWESLLVIAAVVVALLGIGLFLRRPNTARTKYGRSRASSSLLIIATTALFLLTLREALNANFWAYHFVFIGVLVSGVATPLRRHVQSAYPRYSASISALFFVLSAAGSFYTIAAFPLLMITALILMDRALTNIGSPRLTLSSISLGLAVGFILPPDFMAFTILSTFFVAVVLIPPSVQFKEEGEEAKRAWLTGLAISLPFLALATSHYHSLSLKLDLEGETLSYLGAALLMASALGAVIVVPFVSNMRPEVVRSTTGAVATALASLLFIAAGTVVTSLILLGMLICFALLAFHYLQGLHSSGTSLTAISGPTLAFVTLLLIVMRLPPITYSLLIAKLPEWLEYALYTPQIMFMFLAVIMTVASVFTSLKRSQQIPRESSM